MAFRRLFIDIETTPNIGVFWDTKLFSKYIPWSNIIVERSVCVVCYKWEGSKRVHTILWDKNQCDKKLLKETIAVMDEADEIVAHNGDRFDIPMIRGRALFHKLPMKPDYVSIDTLKLVRKQFKLNSNALNYVQKYTGGKGKIDYGGMDTIKKILLKNNRTELKRFADYCKNDVTELEEFYNTLVPYIVKKSHRGIAAGESRLSCPECGSKNYQKRGTKYLKSGGISQGLSCCSCHTHWTMPYSIYQKLLGEDLDAKEAEKRARTTKRR